LDGGRTYGHSNVDEVIAWLSVMDRQEIKEIRSELGWLDSQRTSCGITPGQNARRIELGHKLATNPIVLEEESRALDASEAAHYQQYVR
jgi:hypothetical protein